MARLLLLLVIATSAKSAENENKSSIMSNLQKLRQVVMEKLTADSSRKSKDIDVDQRKGKSFGYYPYIPNFLNYPSDMGYYFPQSKTPTPQEWRTEPFKRKNPAQLLDSPIYYVRLPPSPYVYVPGMGFVSRPPNLNEPEVLSQMAEKPEPPQQTEIRPEDFLHVPIDYVSNAKPTGVYQLPNEQVKPKPDSLLYNLDKGPYIYNGKPVELYVLRNSYNSMYADALTNFYP